VKSLDTLGVDEAQRLEGLVVDLDDTVLDHGLLSVEAFAAVHRLREIGLPMVVATGRPLGWAEVVARTWPVDFAVAENGAVAARREGARLVRLDAVSDDERASRRARLLEIAARLLAAFPEAALADDNSLRRTDVTIDVGETRRLPREAVVAMQRAARDEGVRTTASSVHVHLSFDGADKATGTLRWLHEVHGIDPSRARSRWAFVGDSGNDASCFAGFATTFGVANVRDHLRALSVPPRFVASEPRGRGFAAIVAKVAAARTAFAP
jgi:hypothetical protein